MNVFHCIVADFGRGIGGFELERQWNVLFGRKNQKKSVFMVCYAACCILIFYIASSWRANDNKLELIELSFEQNVASNCLRIIFPGIFARNGISVQESSCKSFISICAITVSNTVHRISIPKVLDGCLFQNVPQAAQFHQAVGHIPLNAMISAACWQNECNVAIGLSNGRVAAIQLGQSTLRPSQTTPPLAPLYMEDAGSSLFATATKENVSILSVSTLTCGPKLHDYLVAAISTSGNLRIWSARDQSCRTSTNMLRNLSKMRHDVDISINVVNDAMIKFMNARSYSADDFRLIVNITGIPALLLCRGSYRDSSCSFSLLRLLVVPTATTLIDFVADYEVLVSIWDGNVICHHEHPGMATGPTSIMGKEFIPLPNSVETQDLLTPGLFSRTCFRAAFEEVAPQYAASCKFNTWREIQTTIELYPDPLDAILESCMIHRARENAPTGLFLINGATFLPSSVLVLRRNRITFLAPTEISCGRQELVLRQDLTLSTDVKELLEYLHDADDVFGAHDIASDCLASDPVSVLFKTIRNLEGCSSYAAVILRSVVVTSRDEMLQKERLDELVESILPPIPSTTVSTSMESHSELMKSALASITLLSCKNLFKLSQRVGMFLALLIENQMLEESIIEYVKHELLPQVARCLNYYALLMYLGTQRMVKPFRVVDAEECPVMFTIGTPVLQAAFTSIPEIDETILVRYGTLGQIDQNFVVLNSVTQLVSHGLSVFLQQTCQYETLRVYLEATLHPTEEECSLLAECYLILGCKHNSKDYFKKAIQMYPTTTSNDSLLELLKRTQADETIYTFALSVSSPSPFILLNAFKYAVDLGHFAQAHRLLAALDNNTDCLRRLILALTDKGQIDFLCHAPWLKMEDQVIEVLEWQAANDTTTTNYYHILYAFYVSRHSYVRAAGAMYAYQYRLQTEAPKDLMSRQAALLSCINALSLVEAEHQWIVYVNKPVTYQDLLKHYVTLAGRLKLYELNRIETSSHIDVVELAILLVEHNAIETAVMILQTHEMEIEPIIRIVAKRGEYELLKQLIMELDSIDTNFHLHLVAVRAILQTDVEKEIPHWLVDSIVGYSSSSGEQPIQCKDEKTMKQRKEPRFANAGANPVGLLQLYVEFGCLIEACRLVLRLMPGLDLQQYEKTKRMEWLPYTVLDELLDQCHAVSDARVKNWTHQLEQQLNKYFNFLQTAQQARHVAELIR